MMAAPIGEAQWAIFQASTTASSGGGGTGNGGGPNLRVADIYGVPNSISPSSYYVPGIASQGVTTADFYNSDGWYSARPYDLTLFGPVGQAAAAQHGRYYWPMTPDHPNSILSSWSDGMDLKGGFGTDPQMPPRAINMQVMPLSDASIPLSNNSVTNPFTTNNSTIYQTGFLYYDPEDTGNTIHWMGEGADQGATGPGIVFTGTTTNTSPIVTGIADTSKISATYPATAATGIPANTTVLSVDSASQITLSNNATASGSRTITAHTFGGVGHYATTLRTNDLLNWTLFGPSTMNPGSNDFTSFQRPTRISAGNWISYAATNYRAFSRLTGPPGDSGLDANGWRSLAGVSTSTDGLNFVRPEPASYIDTLYHVGTRRFNAGGQWDQVIISGQQWLTTAEDARNILITAANPAVVSKTAHGLVAGNQITLAAVPFPGGGPYTADLVSGSSCITNFAPAIGSSVEAGNKLSSNPVFYTAGGAIIVGIPPNTVVTSVGVCGGANSIQINNNVTVNATGSPIVFLILPIPLVDGQTYFVKTVLDPDSFTISATNGGAAIDTSIATVNPCIDKSTPALCNVPNGGMFVTRVAVDSNFNILASPAPVRVSDAYFGVWPGPTYLQAVNSYLESGVLTYYATRGFFVSSPAFGLPWGATYLNGGALQQQLLDIYSECIDVALCYASAPMGLTASAAAGVVTLTWNDTRPNQNYHLYYGFSPSSQPNLIGSITGLTTTYTPYLQTPATMYFKLVSLDNSSVEQGSRVVSAYVSSSTAFVNQHIARALDDGADPATIDRNKLDTVDAWITSNGLHNMLENWVSASFGVKQDTSGIVTKVYDLGTTRHPAYNDLWFCSGAFPCNGASNTTYHPTGLNNNTPAWTNNAANAFGIIGGVMDASNHNGRMNHIRRKVEVSVFASYAKTASGTDITLLGIGEFSGMHLQHLAGTPGTASFTLYDDSLTPQTATIAVPTSATTPHIIGGTFGCGATPAVTCPADTSPGSLNVYIDGVQGSTPSPALHYNAGLSLSTTLKGQLGGVANIQFYVSGAKDSKFNYGLPSTYVMDDSSAGFTMSDLIIFSKELTPTQAASLTTLLQGFVSPPTAITAVAAGGISMGSPAVYDITAMPSGASATCNTGTPANDSPAFANFQTLASAWDAANPGATGSIVLNIPNSTCWFLGSTGIAPFKWVMNPSGYAGQARVRVVGAGTSSKLSDGGTGGGFFPGGGGQFGNNTSQTRVTTVSKGATALNFTACPGAGCAAALALFAPGAPVLMTGVDLQGEGQPTNPAFWDFLTVATVTATGVTVTTPITHDYKSTWPNYSTGNGFQPDQGGPGTLYVLDPTWNVSIELNRLILDQGAGAGGSVTNGKSVTLKNVVITSAATSCQGPSVNGFLAWINVTATNCTVEVDKLIDTFVLQNVTAITNVDWQSASAKQFIASEVTASSFLGAGGINNIVANSSPAELHLGSHGYGASYGRDYIIGNNIPILIVGSASQSMINLRGTWSGGVLTVPPNFTFSAAQNSSAAPCSAAPGNICLTVSSTTGWSTGMATDTIVLSGSASCQGDWILTVVDATHVILNGSTFAATCTGGSATLPLKWAVPGANLYWDGANTSQGPMAQVLDVGASGANTTVTTSLAGAFPTMPLNSGVATVKVQSVPQVFASGNYGSAAAIDLNQTPAGAPYGSYSKLIVAGTNGSYASVPASGSPTVTGNPSTPYTVPVWGQMVGINLTVGPAYSGSTGTMNFLFAQSYFTQTLGSGSVPGAWNPTVNAKIASTTPRFLGPTSTSGAQTLDVLSSPPGGANSWLLTNQTQPVYTSIPGDFSTTSTTVEIVTNQGVVNPAQQ
jgi:hypothetical protein